MWADFYTAVTRHTCTQSMVDALGKTERGASPDDSTALDQRRRRRARFAGCVANPSLAGLGEGDTVILTESGSDHSKVTV